MFSGSFAASLSQMLALAAMGQAAPPGQPLIKVLGGLAMALLILALFICLVLVKGAFVAGGMWFGLMFPRLTSGALELYQERGKKCFFLGLLYVFLGILISVLLMVTQALAVFGFALLVFLGVLAVGGYGVAYRSAGRRLLGREAVAEGPENKACLLGGLMAELTFTLPILGQILSVGVLFRGVGAVGLAMLAQRRARKNEGATPSESGKSVNEASTPTEQHAGEPDLNE